MRERITKGQEGFLCFGLGCAAAVGEFSRDLVGFAHSPCSVYLVFEHISGEVSCILHWHRFGIWDTGIGSSAH